MLESSKKLFSLFNANYVVYCNWKGTSKIEEGVDGVGDIDILMSPKSKELAESLLEKTGYVKVQTQWVCRFKDIYDWIGFDEDTGKLTHVHLHYRMIAGHTYTMEYTLPWADDVLKDRVLLANGMYSISPEWELIVFLTRLGLEYPNKKVDVNNGRLKQEALSELKYIQEHVDWHRFSETAKKCYGDGSNVIVGIGGKQSLTKGDFERLANVATSHFGGRLLNRLYKVVSKLKSLLNDCTITTRVFHVARKKCVPHGLVIAVMGQDGSGKSTVTNDILQWLDWKLEVRRFYLGSGDEYYNPWQRKLKRKLNDPKFSWAKPLQYWLYFSEYLASARYVLRTVKRARKYANKGGIALMDRYPQDEFYGINDGPKIRVELLDKVPQGLKWLAKMYARSEERCIIKAASNEPSMVFKLMLSPEESMRRKPFENYEAVKMKHEIIKTLTYPKSQVVRVDAEQPYEEEITSIKKKIWQRIQK